MHRRGFTLTELAVSAAVAAVTAALAGPVMMAPEARLSVSLRNMHVIGATGGSYRLDNDDYLPITLTWKRGTAASPTSGGLEGFGNWSAGGKNNDRYWWGRILDIEAADRPLNPYIMPGKEFFAPPPPASLGRDDPHRVSDQAPPFRDPADFETHQRRWPGATPGITAYNDVGTSYLWNVHWWNQTGSMLDIEERMAEGTRRMAKGIYARPDRFVWMFDEYGDIIPGRTSGPSQIVNGHGDVNKAVLLMIDGRAGYFSLTPGRTLASYRTPNYTFVFEDLPPPGS